MKRKEQAIRRTAGDRTRERVSLFFINRPIKSDPPRCFISFSFSSLSLRPILPCLFSSSCRRSSLFCSILFFLSVANPSAHVSVSLSVRFTSFLSVNLLFLLRREEAPLSAGSAAVREKSSLFAILFNFFARGRTPFITWAHDSSV